MKESLRQALQELRDEATPGTPDERKLVCAFLWQWRHEKPEIEPLLEYLVQRIRERKLKEASYDCT